MGLYYPQGVVLLRVMWEDFGNKDIAKLQEFHSLPLVPKTLRVNINDYTQADTFECEIDYKTFPFDPRAIRSCGITIHLEDKKALYKEDGRSPNIIDTTKENTVFQGFADKDRIVFSPESRTVHLEGRDFTSLLIDQQCFKDPLQLTKPLDQVIADLLAELKATASMKVDNRVLNSAGVPESLPNFADLWPEKAAGTTSAHRNTRKNYSYWDMIQKICSEAGILAYVELDKLVLTKPRNLFSRKENVLFVYGTNISDLEFERKLGRMKDFNVQVTSLNVEKKEVLNAKIPEEATEDWIKKLGIKKEAVTILKLGTDGKPLTGEQAEKAPYITFRLKDITNKDFLVTRGEEIFEEISRQQIEGKLTTREMRIAYGEVGGKKDTSINATALRIGTPIEIEINQGDLVGLRSLLADARKIHANYANAQEAERPGLKTTLEAHKSNIIKALKMRGFPDKVADALSESLIKINTPFYTKAIELSLDNTAGFTMKIDFINFIELKGADVA